MKQAKITISNKAGLHARAASKLADVTSRYASDIQVGHSKMVDGKSILSLMMLAAVKGTEIQIKAEGSDEEEALAAILEIIENRFDEPE